MREKKKFQPTDILDFKRKALRWAERFLNFQYLNGNSISYLYDSFPELLSVGNTPAEMGSKGFSFSSLSEEHDWWFGYLGYGFSQQVYHEKTLGFTEGEWFRPQILLFFGSDGSVEIEATAPNDIYDEILAFTSVEVAIPKIELKAQLAAEEYISKVVGLQAHLSRGNVYQVNFCTSFSAINVDLPVVEVYDRLNSLSPMPFSALLKLNEKYIISASPERYLKKRGNQLVSQPIKGTAPRGKTQIEDAQNALHLEQSPKERAENIMIVDLTRNDLSRVCLPGSVKVALLCEVKTFRTLHQMVSTVVGEVEEPNTFNEIIEATFPMGSMTGAPKIRAMELIHEFEDHARGPFSGTVGYINPDGDFDFNVLIRSIFYNKDSRVLSFSVGSGITVLSDPAAEYEECLLKASAIAQVLGNE